MLELLNLCLTEAVRCCKQRLSRSRFFEKNGKAAPERFREGSCIAFDGVSIARDLASLGPGFAAPRKQRSTSQRG